MSSATGASRLGWFRTGWQRGAIGAVLGIALAALLGHLVPAGEGLPWIMAPVGASAVLVFAVPASPLAQPWPVVGGNLISVLVGMAVGKLCALGGIGAPVAVSLAVGGAIAVMAIARCTHPPGGAAAILGAMAGIAPAAHLPGPLAPLALNVIGIAGVGWLYNAMTGHPWPHIPVVPPSPAPLRTVTYDREDLDAVLADWDETLDVEPDDLDALFRAVERRVLRRWEDDHK
ncbi:HPP family protein [Novosphingobium sp. ERW19]|uniref:HPP family protein n=1 Tax=Novosphingobium sp. ERW19 TaxID=2726186 RepID=UPI001457544A|nr:HPP family protein [Novosphingobium sp. ERW19]MBA4087872.1 HPP family protein [Novosphingobium sp.]NLR39247.1 HPP family protein [Novosphingobium sp. ERW19]